MRLLNIQTLQFQEFNSTDIPPYVIASHRWSTEETTYRDFKKRRNVESPGYQKVVQYCDFLKSLFKRINNTEIKWFWIDTCCIDKSSSAELSESINSMFQWYADASVCLAYLSDVHPQSTTAEFQNSEWFRRGWTLQELIAPKRVLFLNNNWEIIGRKDQPDLLDAIADGTGIPKDVLIDHRYSKSISIPARMKWMENRTTSRLEDMSYCLLGIFDVHMPLVYGEGAKARRRLMKEIEDSGAGIPVQAPTVNQNLMNELARQVLASIDKTTPFLPQPQQDTMEFIPVPATPPRANDGSGHGDWSTAKADDPDVMVELREAIRFRGPDDGDDPDREAKEMQKQDPLGLQMWKLYHKTKSQLPNGERLENLSWRMMAMTLQRQRYEMARRIED